MAEQQQNEHGSLLAAMREARELREAREGVDSLKSRPKEEKAALSKPVTTTTPTPEPAPAEPKKSKRTLGRGTPLQQAQKFSDYQRTKRRKRRRQQSNGETHDFEL